MLRKLDTTCIIWTPILYWASQETQVAKNLSANTGATGEWVQSLGQNDALEEKMAIHSRFLAGIILWTEEPGGLHSMESQKSQIQPRATKQQQYRYLCNYLKCRHLKFKNS